MGHDTLVHHALARFDDASTEHATGRLFAVRLADGIQRLEPSWAEAVAVTKAVAQRLARCEMPPAVGDLLLHASGHVSFPPGGIAADDVAIQALARLLARLTGDQGCPLEVWDAIERAQVAPMTFRTARGFAASIQSVPDDRTAACVAAYVRELQRRPAAATTVAPGRPRAQRRLWAV